jgi:quercetin dioxygenase-like cupin family protein
MNSSVLEKSKAMIIVEMIEYVTNSIISKNILNKSNGNVCLMSFDIGESLLEKVIPFDALMQIIDGSAEIVIDGKSHFLDVGKSIIIPAHSSNLVKANERFKMILTIIKSGYES